VAESPTDMFGKAMSVPDELMNNYFTLLTKTGVAEIAKLTDPGQTHPRDARWSWAGRS
jgi:tyrosyl-tRNA synthetase